MIANTLQMMFAFVLVLAPLVFIHEFGHFIVAKLFGIGVPVFSLGFGPRLFGFRRAETDYRVSLVPLGGYVRLSGDEADENATGAPDEFLSRPRYQRFFVFVAGAAFNVILAFLAFWVLFAVFGKEQVPDVYPSVRQLAPDSRAEQSGLEPDDRIIEISGKDVRGEAFLQVMSREITLAPNSDRELLIERDGRRMTIVMNTGAAPKFGHGAPGWLLSFGEGQSPVISSVESGKPAEHGGMKRGDLVLGAGGLEPINLLEFRLVIESNPGQELEFKIERDGEVKLLTVVPADEGGTGRIGVGYQPQAIQRVPIGVAAAAAESLRVNLAMSKTLFIILRRLVTGNMPLTTMSGPIGIAQVARDAVIAGPETFLYLLGFFSLQLGILNLLPIPVLDGGHILILGVESVMRRALSDKLKERVMQAGFVFLLAFMGVIIYLDIVKL